MRQKSEVFRHFQRFKNEVEKATSRHVQCLWSDGGNEYFSDDFTAYLWKEGIRREFSCRQTPQQNGVAKWKNRHIVEVVRAMMYEKNLLKSYWAKAANTTIYLMNRLHNLWGTRRNPLLEVFGKRRIYHIPEYSARSPTCIFLTRSDKSSTRSWRNVSS